MAKETREQYAARRARIEETRAKRREVRRALRESGALGEHEPTAKLYRRAYGRAAEGDYDGAADLIELAKLRRANSRLAAKVDEYEFGAERIRDRARANAFWSGWEAGRTDAGISAEKIAELRLARKQARASRRASKVRS